ncbi:MAG: histidine phosphatase family protein [Alphaproteobacteria bacterium]|nr:histidine phosphatase family protein [Alphaproteobacteria bacterium]MCB9930152.1 histidine phosphatase family protein [Alphaproteobacteria bacterium]
MPLLSLIRHAPTTWNEAGRIQGQTDTPLSEAGRAALLTWEPPAPLLAADWWTSPLQRCRDTARHLAGRTVAVDERLQETNWGDWQGKRLTDLRESLGEEMAEMEGRGWDFQPPGGESPRQVSARFQDFVRAVAERDRPTVAVTHRGVIRVAMALATGWDFLGKSPVKLRRPAAHVFWVTAEGTLELRDANVPLGEPVP